MAGITLPSQKDQTKAAISGILPIAGKAVGSIFGPVGGAVGGAVGGVAGNIAGQQSDEVAAVEQPDMKAAVQRRVDAQNAGPALQRGREIAEQEAPDLVPVLDEAIRKQQEMEAARQQRRMG
jgi:hypothetical protein